MTSAVIVVLCICFGAALLLSLHFYEKGCKANQMVICYFDKKERLQKELKLFEQENEKLKRSIEEQLRNDTVIIAENQKLRRIVAEYEKEIKLFCETLRVIEQEK